MLVLATFAFQGCAAEYTSSGYYAPSYGAIYADYGYDGIPWWGVGPFVDTEIIVAGHRHHRHYGGHHYAHDWHRGGEWNRGGFNRGGFRGRPMTTTAPMRTRGR
jgi:hypothetical protein